MHLLDPLAPQSIGVQVFVWNVDQVEAIFRRLFFLGIRVELPLEIGKMLLEFVLIFEPAGNEFFFEDSSVKLLSLLLEGLQVSHLSLLSLLLLFALFL